MSTNRTNSSLRAPANVRFWRFFEQTDDCWEWQGARTAQGYGEFGTGLIRPRLARAHRFSWELHFGPIPAGLKVCHHCDNPPCVRPDHLFLGTQRDNVRDAVAKGRHRANPPVGVGVKLSDAQVREVRAWYASGKATHKEIARLVQMAPDYIRRIVCGRIRAAEQDRLAGTAQNAKKTECIHGHPFDADNTYCDPSGKRVCLTCRREWDRLRYLRYGARRRRWDARP